MQMNTKMNISKNKFVNLGLIIAFTICIFFGMSHNLLYAQETTPSFQTYPQAQADLIWVTIEGTEESTGQGSFLVTLPDKFIYIIDDNSGVAKVSGYKGVSGFHYYNGQVDYDYNSFPLFAVYESLFGLLLEATDKKGTWLSDGTIVGRQVQLYQMNDSQNTYWYDQETGIPLKIASRSGDNQLNLKQYKVEPYNAGEMVLVNLLVHDSTWDGFIILENLEGYWLPQTLFLTEDGITITIDYANWQLLEENFQIPDLEQLDKYLEQGHAAYQANDLEGIVTNFKQVLRIDPFNTMAYAYLAYAYGELDNYLGAVESYQQWLMLAPDNPTALNNLAYTYMLAGNFVEQAIAMAHQAYQINPTPYTLDTLGYGYYLIKDYEKALQYLEYAALELTGTPLVSALEHLILVYQALEDWENIAEYRQQIKALKMETENGGTLFQ